MNTCYKLGWAVWIVATAWLIYNNQSWGSYDVFTAFTIGGNVVANIFGHYFNSRWNSPIGEPYKGR